MFKWRCLMCGEVIWCCNTCTCGNTRENNAIIAKKRREEREKNKRRGTGR